MCMEVHVHEAVNHVLQTWVQNPSFANLGAYRKNIWNRTSHGPGTFAFANHRLAMQISDPNL